MARLSDRIERLRLKAARSVSSRRGNRIIEFAAGVSAAYLNLYENFSYEMAMNGELRVLEVAVPSAGGIVFDVGSNIGDYSAEVLDRTAADVHCFEIVPEVAAQLRDRFAGSSRVAVNAFGLADRGGTVPVLFAPEFSAGSSICGYEHADGAEWVDCKVRTGDAYCEEVGVTQIDLLKIDAEGSDLAVLQGFSGMLGAGRLKVIQFEYGRANILSGALLRDFAGLFDANGYVFGKVFPEHVEFRPYTVWHEDFRGPNYVAVSRSDQALVEALSRR